MTEKAKPTQNFVDIDKIENNIIYMKNGTLRKVLLVNGINFNLKSDEEQEIILSSFQNFLNTLDFSIQIFIHSRKINIDNYLDKIKQRREEEDKKLLKIQIEEYIEFVKSFVQQNPIITKNFFVVIPYKSIELIENTKRGFSSFLNSLTGKTNQKGTEKEDEDKKIQQLDYRVDEVQASLEQIGLRTQILKNEEIMELFYNLYNPDFIEKNRKI
jgi:chaperonin GroEL (HSP60 family)